MDGDNASPTYTHLPAAPADEPGHQHFHAVVYKRRWWILIVFCLCALTQSTLWNTWSPMLDAMYIAYGWKQSFIALLPALSNGGYVILAFPFMYIVETGDLRLGLVIAASLLGFGTAAWNIALPTGQSWLIAIGSLLVGITACITMAAPPLLSALWFPASERTTATAFAAMAGYLGTGIAFISGPYISGANVTTREVNNKGNLSAEFIHDLRKGITNVVYFDSALAACSLLLVIFYFPARPPKPPSKSQTIEREDFWHGIKHLALNPQFWILNIAYNVPNGTFNSWIPLVSANFRNLGIGEETAGWIGFASIVASCSGSILMSMVADHFKRKTKIFLVATNIVSIVLFAILSCITMEYIHIPQAYVKPVLYVLCIAAALSVNGVIPLYYELGVESAYPVHEGLACSFITIINNVCGMTLFLLFLIPPLSADPRWMSWACLGTCIFSFPLLLMLREHFYRLDVETSSESSAPGSINS